MRTDLTRKREEYRRALEDSLARLVALLSEDPTVQRLILFGSYARGRADLRTDLDLVVIQESDLGFLDRMAEISRRVGSIPVDVDILVYTPQEWERVQETPFGRMILKEGMVLYEKVAP
ncbi:MAG: nucleotidyltransferase domain-containing protein [Anaerolineae bacterium]|nr:nucleotidyltransferase domain-containing protein [Anaerolineae bacterium]